MPVTAPLEPKARAWAREQIESGYSVQRVAEALTEALIDICRGIEIGKPILELSGAYITKAAARIE